MPVILRWLLRLGPSNPIAVRLVQNGSRRPRHLYVRAAYLGVLIIVLLWTLLARSGAGDLSYRELAQAGSQSFTFVAYLQIGLICVLAPVFMAGAIAQEASPRTWEVLLTTPLSPAEIVLGNLFGRLFFILALLFASLPLFALVQYFGGVPGRTIFASYGVSACAAVFVGVVAIGLSVSRLVGRRAVFTFYIAVVTYLAVTLALDAWLTGSGRGAGPNGDGVTAFTCVNPFLALRALLNPATYPRGDEGSAWYLRNPVSAFCWISLGLSVLLAAASVLTVRIGGLGAVVSRGGGGVPWYRRVLGLGGKGAEHRPPRAVWSNPIAWREAAARNATLGRMAARWLFIILGVAFGLGLVGWYHTLQGPRAHDEFRLALLFTVLAETVVIVLVAMNMSASAISREREDGTLDLLLTTTITPSSYLSGKLRGLIAYLLPMLAVPIVTLAAAGVYVLFDGFGRAGGTMVTENSNPPMQVPVVLPEGALIASLVLIPFTAFCCMIGLQWSLKSKGALGSVVGTVGVVGIVAGIVGVCGWRAAIDAALLGPVAAALSPASALFSLVEPADAMFETVREHGLDAARVSLLIGSALAAGLHTAIVYGIHVSMVRHFDFTVRKLAGTK